MLIVITGGTSGIGLHTAKKLLEQGHKTILLGLNKENQSSVEKQLSQWKSNFETLFFDLSNFEDLKKNCDLILNKWGAPDVLINNAGATTYETFNDMNFDQIHRDINVNFTGAVLLTKYFLSHFVKRKKGHIINVSSIAGDIVLMPNMVYMSCKQALNAWSEALRIELEPFSINVSLVCPGRVDTAFFDHETFKKRIQRPEMKIALPADSVAKKIVNLLSTPKNKIYIPFHYSLIAWLYRAIPGIKEIAFRHLLRNRIRDYYRRT